VWDRRTDKRTGKTRNATYYGTVISEKNDSWVASLSCVMCVAAEFFVRRKASATAGALSVERKWLAG